MSRFATSRRARILCQIAAANRRLYSHGEAVDGYLRDDYHRLRQQLCYELTLERLVAGFRSSAPGSLRVVDVGASSGGLGRTLARAGIGVVAADLEPGAVSSARAAGVEPLCFDAVDPWPLADGSLQGVVMGELIEHVFDTAALLAECHRVLVPGGVLTVTTPNLATFQDRLRFLLGSSPRQVDPLHDYLHVHIRPFTGRSLAAALCGAGFTDCELHSNHWVLRLRGRRVWRSRWLARCFPGLGGSLVMVATKKAA